MNAHIDVITHEVDYNPELKFHCRCGKTIDHGTVINSCLFNTVKCYGCEAKYLISLTEFDVSNAR